MADKFGTVAIGVTIAHEVGHAMQARARLSGSSVLVELQADCFSGAFFAHAVDGDVREAVSRDDLDEALLAVLSFRDTPGIAAGRRSAHGNGFDRVNAFQLGFEGGVARCAAFEREPPQPTASAFNSIDDLISGGNSAFEPTLEFSLRSLNASWSVELPGFDQPRSLVAVDANAMTAFNEACVAEIRVAELVSVCPSDGVRSAVAVVAVETALRVHRDFGDFALATMVADAWSIAAQARLSVPTAGRFRNPTLGVACLTGGWMGAVAAERLGVLLSPGDLDEAVGWIIDSRDTGLPFERISAMRAGFLGSRTACA